MWTLEAPWRRSRERCSVDAERWMFTTCPAEWAAHTHDRGNNAIYCGKEQCHQLWDRTVPPTVGKWYSTVGTVPYEVVATTNQSDKESLHEPFLHHRSL